MRDERPRNTIKMLLENRGAGVSRAMKESGYSAAYSKNPQQFKKTKTFQEVFSNMISSDDLAQKHHELLNASNIQHYSFPPSDKKLTNKVIKDIIESVAGCRLIYVKRIRSDTTAYFQSPDNRSRKDALDLAYKVRGDYAAEKVVLQDEIDNLTDVELLARKKAIAAKLKKK